MNPVIKYFTGEKAESYLFIIAGVLALALAFYFVFALKTTFWKGVAVPFVTVALLELIVGYTIVTRSPKDIVRVEAWISQQPLKIKTDEIPRMQVVMRNFVVFRYMEIALILLGIVLMYSTLNDTFWRGLGLGLFMQAGIVLSLDFFAERRGHLYLEYLNQLAGVN
ncbi:hypothetical protein F5984_10465 [Rudanella paleaurantiibacter]|uniref:Uncharacterized protein n=1 Tax=Rudanella paleaurantiibacter TaxID=2614655 RepID=A0A7J5U0R2_9BACT|nr:hypothetical protein [Rudanella paleaurantiibacter]KAB7731217.1 hypothetical protein F5984_10465 [Rudanella paleaurantiibacter]